MPTPALTDRACHAPGPRPNPQLDFQASIPRGLFLETSRLGTHKPQPRICLPPRGKLCHSDLHKTLRPGETCMPPLRPPPLLVPHQATNTEADGQLEPLSQLCPQKTSFCRVTHMCCLALTHVPNGRDTYIARKCSRYGCQCSSNRCPHWPILTSFLPKSISVWAESLGELARKPPSNLLLAAWVLRLLPGPGPGS